MTVKNVIIKNIADDAAQQERLEAINHILSTAKDADRIRLRIYQAEQDPNVIVEKWEFSDEALRKSFTESEGIALGPWPDGNHDHELGDLSLDSDNYWEE